MGPNNTDLSSFQELGTSSMAAFWVVVLIISAFILIFFLAGWWLFNAREAKSPYLGGKGIFGHELSFPAIEKVHQFLSAHHDVNNPIFDLNNACVCKTTGRIFPDTLGFAGAKSVGWSFISRMYPGAYVSWGSLSPQERDRLYSESPELFEGYQIHDSSAEEKPKKASEYHQALKPGPLYIDRDSKVLVGWKCVPETVLEVLVVQDLKTTKVK